MIPKTLLTFDTNNYIRYLKGLLSLDSGSSYLDKRIDSEILTKCNGDMEEVRKAIKEWLIARDEAEEADKKPEPETQESEKVDIKDKISALIAKNKEESDDSRHS